MYLLGVSVGRTSALILILLPPVFPVSILFGQCEFQRGESSQQVGSEEHGDLSFRGFRLRSSLFRSNCYAHYGAKHLFYPVYRHGQAFDDSQKSRIVNGRLSREQLEWRPAQGPDDELVVDFQSAEMALQERSAREVSDPDHERAPVVYTPLIAGTDPIGVLIVFCNAGQKIDALQQRTIATVSAQMALTAQNLQLIEKLRETFESSIAAVAGAVEARDGYTDQHCRRLAAFSSLMGTRMGMPEDEIRAMELGALLHDVGKIGIPDSILNKPGRFSSEERSVMERHPEIGHGIVAPVVGLEKTTLECVLHHHERWNGEGYPEGLAGEEIPLAARIVSIVDVWDALSTSRPYKTAYSQEKVRDILTKGRGTQFDPILIDLFFEVLHDEGDEMLALIARSSMAGGLE